jgi:hypothetical protein
MGKVRVPFELPEELKKYFEQLIRKINPGIGLNPFLRAVMFCLSDVTSAFVRTVIERGAEIERDFEAGEYKLESKGDEDGYFISEQLLLNLARFHFEPDQDDALSDTMHWWQGERVKLLSEIRQQIQEELQKVKDEKPDSV